MISHRYDQAFVKDLKFGKVDSPNPAGHYQMGRALRLHIVAEGVETTLTKSGQIWQLRKDWSLHERDYRVAA